MKRFFMALALTAMVVVLPPFAHADDYTFVEGDVLGGETLSAEVAAWLNVRKGSSTTKAEYKSRLDDDGLSIEQEYLLNTSPVYNSTVDFRISSIAVSNVVSMDVDLIRKDLGFLIEAPINGQVAVQRCDTPDGTFSGDTWASGNSVTLPLKENEPQKFYRAAVVRNADYIFTAAVPLSMTPTADDIVQMERAEVTDAALRAGLRIVIPTSYYTTTIFVAVPMSYRDKIEWFAGDGATHDNPPEPTTVTGVNGQSYAAYKWAVGYGIPQTFILKLKKQ